MAKLEFARHDGDPYHLLADGEYYSYSLHKHMCFIHKKGGSLTAHDICVNPNTDVDMEENKKRVQFIEDNYKTLTLEQLDNIEEVYLKAKEGK